MDNFQQQNGSEAGKASASDPLFLLLGRIIRPHGVRGELRLSVLTDFPERIAGLERVYVGSDPYRDDDATPYAVEAVRRHREALLVSLEGIRDRDAADLLRGKLLMVALDDAVPLDDDEYYLYQTLGMAVVTTEGEALGTVREILETGANDVLVIRGGLRGEVLLPDTDEVVVDFDLETRTITVNLLPGLMDS